jgi:hypothetical protein
LDHRMQNWAGALIWYSKQSMLLLSLISHEVSASGLGTEINSCRT